MAIWGWAKNPGRETLSGARFTESVKRAPEVNMAHDWIAVRGARVHPRGDLRLRSPRRARSHGQGGERHEEGGHERGDPRRHARRSSEESTMEAPRLSVSEVGLGRNYLRVIITLRR